MADIFQEIDEDIRRERFRQLWQNYRHWAFVGAGIIVLLTGGLVEWQQWRRTQVEQRGSEYAAAVALLANDTGRGIADLKAIGADGSDGYPLLARMRVAAAEAKQGDRAKAIADYRALAADTGVARPYRDLATILAAFNALGTEPDAAVEAMVQPLAAPTSAWRFSAEELTALAKWHGGDKAAALKIYQSLADDLDAPQSIRGRASEIIADYSR